MKRTITLIMCMAFALLLTAVAQSITHTFSDVSMSDALKYLQQHTSRYKIVFIYDDLEDYKVTTTVKNKSVPEAIRQMIGFYPIKMTWKENREIYVEAILKTERRLKGVVVDEHNLPLAYANVTLLNPTDSTMVGGGVTNESGRFVIPIEHGKVIARISYVGYKTAYRLCNRDNVGTIKMHPDITALKETVVTAAKMQIERDGANYTLRNLGGTIMGNAGNALDLLRWTPGVIVGMNEDISLIGRDGKTEVYLNDRRITNNAELKAVTSQDIKRVEIIREPDAQYASTANAVIKLYTHSSIKNHLGASLTEVLDFKHKVSNATTLTIDGKYNKLSGNVSLGYSRNYSRSYNMQYTHAYGRGVKNDTTSYQGSGDNYRVFAGINYAFTPKSVLGVQFSGDFSKTGIDLHSSRKNNHGFVNILTNKQCDMALRSDHQSISASYSWQRTDDSRLLLIYDRALSWQSNRQDVLSPGLAPQTIDYYNDYEISTATAKYDFVTRGWEHKTGLEWGNANNFSEVEKEGDIQRSKRNNYWTSAYYALSKQWNRWRLNLGLRYEYDFTRTRQDVVIRYEKTYHDLLPSLKVGYRVNDDLDLMASYRRTLVRPSYNQLRTTFYFNVLPYNSLGYSFLSSSEFMTGYSSQENLPYNNLSPNIIYLGADDIATGNHELRPTATDRFALTAQYRHFAAQMSYNRVDNAIQTVHQLLSSGALLQSPINIGRIHALSLDLDYSFNNRYFNVFLLASGTWPRIPVPSLGRDEIESRPFAVLLGNLQYNLSQHVMLGCNLLYSTPWTSGCSTRCNSRLGLNLSVMARLLGDRLTLGANFNDVFKSSMSTRNETQYVNVFNSTDIHNDSRSVSLMVRWTFNTINNPFKRRSGNDATLQRTQETVN
jgi:hypothetical protein